MGDAPHDSVGLLRPGAGGVGGDHALGVWDKSKSNEQYVAPFGVRFHHVPFGHAPYYESSFRKHTEGKALAQDIDVRFVKHVSERRRLPPERLQQLDVKVQTMTRTNPLYGAKLDEVQARSKIVVGSHRFGESELHKA